MSASEPNQETYDITIINELYNVVTSSILVIKAGVGVFSHVFKYYKNIKAISIS